MNKVNNNSKKNNFNKSNQINKNNVSSSISIDKNNYDNNTYKNNSIYEEYYDESTINHLISNNQAFIGKLFISPTKRKTAYVKVDNLNVDVYISDEIDRNRSFIGDTVVVLLYPKNEWNSFINNSINNDTIIDEKSNMPEINEISNRLWKPKVNLLIDGIKENKNKLKSENSIDIICKTENLQPKGKVIKVLERNHKSTLIGAITSPNQFKPNEKLPSTESRLYFQPSDLCYPNCIIPRLELPSQFIDNPYQFQNNIYMIDIEENWPTNSKFPYAKNVRSIGESGSINSEIEATLAMNNITTSVFSNDVMESVRQFLQVEDIDGMTQQVDWQIPIDEIKNRKDLRNYRICTIDPSTAKDLDDAVHIEPLSDGTFSVGVHIADVSYFLQEDSPLDIEARNRATSVYLVQKVIPMLPPILCEQLCSLNPNVDRLAFSCIFKMNSDGTLCDEKPWFGKTIIRSCSKLDYPTAQRMIDGIIPLTEDDAFLSSLPNDIWELSRRPIGQSACGVVKDVILLNQLAIPRRKLRYENGALVIQNMKLIFKLDNNGNPMNISTYAIHDSNRLIEEYMLLANYLVAEELLQLVGKAAFLRNHVPPKLSDMSIIKQFCEKSNIQIDFTSINSIFNGLKNIKKDNYSNSILNSLLVQPMQLAKYIIANNESSQNWSHFGLSIPYYTHFTSPIRRYADVIVHRLLFYGLNNECNNSIDDRYIDKLSSIAQHCNNRREAAKTVQERCDRIYLSVYIMSNPFNTEAIVIGVGNKSFTVLILQYGITSRLFTDEMIGIDTNYNEITNQLTLTRNISNTSKYQTKQPMINYISFENSLIIEIQKMLIVHVSARTLPPIDIIVSLVGPKM